MTTRRHPVFSAACALLAATALALPLRAAPEARADRAPLPPEADLAQFLPSDHEFPAGWTVGETDNRGKSSALSKDGLLAGFGQHATPRNCYPDALVFFSAFGVAKGGKPQGDSSGSYVFVTISRQPQDSSSRGYTKTLRYWADNCSQFSVAAIPDWSGPLAGSVLPRSVPLVGAEESIAIQVTERGTGGRDVEMTAIAARLRGVEILVTGYPGADERLVDDLYRSTAERIDEWEP